MAKEEGKKAVSTLDIAKKAIIKKYGDVVKPMSDKPLVINTISTRSLGLDAALGRGGFALGRIYEIYGENSSGKTTLAMSLIAEAQARGMRCAFVDAEHSAYPPLFESMGVDLEKLTVVDLFTGEDNLSVAETLMRTGEIDLLVIDSVTSLIPKVAAEASLDDQTIALLARLMSKTLLRYVPIAAETQTCVVFINQTRNKIGGYGCFHYNTLVNFCDGRSIPIGKVVDERIEGSVWCLNENTNKLECKPILDWHDNGVITSQEDFIHIQTSSIDGKGRFGFTCTPNHKILTNAGWKEAKYLYFNDKLVSKYTRTMTGSYGDFLRGSLVGDSTLMIRHINTGAIKLQDKENPEYLEWKVNKLRTCINFNFLKTSKGCNYTSVYTYEFAKIKRELGNRDPMYLLNNFSNLGFAVWVMDDGHLDLKDGHRRYSISVKRFKCNKEKLDEIVSVLDKLGFICTYNLKDGSIHFSTDYTDFVASSICKYVPECMSYKLPFEYRGKYKDFSLHKVSEIVTDFVNIKELRPASLRQLRNKRKFDISVGDNHNYMVGGKYNGVIVHNSPETTSGGEALPFYATGRVRVSGIGAKANRIIDDKGKVIGHKTIFEVVKNKLAAPFTSAEADLIYGKGYDTFGEIIKIATDLGVLTKSGSWYNYEGNNIGQGENGVRRFFNENPDVFLVIKQNVTDILGLTKFYDAQREYDLKQAEQNA